MATGPALFGRYATVTFTSDTGSVQIGNDYAIVLGVAMTGKDTTATVRIINPPEQAMRLAERGATITIVAGYEQANSILFLGDIKSVIPERTETENILVVKAKSASNNTRDKIITVSAKKGIGAKSVLNTIAALAGTRIEIGAEVTDKSFPAGYAFIGSPRSAINEVVSRIGAKATMTSSGTYQIQKIGAPATQSSVVRLNSTTGLLGYPKKLVRKNSTKKEERGWEITSLLSAKLGPGKTVLIDSEVPGLENQEYRIEEATHAGGNRAGEWVTNIKCFTKVTNR